MLAANNPKLKSWVNVREGSDFPIQNLPFGIFSTGNSEPRVGVAIGDQVLDLAVIHHNGLFNGLNLPADTFKSESLNAYMSLGKEVWTNTRNRISQLLKDSTADLRDDEKLVKKALIPMKDAMLLMPVSIGDYTDFYASKEHATNVGCMFRDPDNALLPNWLHLPVGYHGRASSVVISGTPLRRPMGQTKADDADAPSYGPSRLVDFELEMGFFIGQGNGLGHQVKANDAEDHVFGMVLFNDWSARDIQKWEYVPLGPFLGKSFGSHVSPWVVTLDALDAFRVDDTKKEKDILPYLKTEGQKNFDINLEVIIVPEKGEAKTVSHSNYKYMYWNMAQMVAHHTVNGCNLRTGDLLATGTISGPTEKAYGSMLELSWKGTKPVQMPDGSERKFIQDGDTVVMKGFCEKNGVRIGFGEVNGKILPALV
jgi:fumarylacetoacetase